MITLRVVRLYSFHCDSSTLLCVIPRWIWKFHWSSSLLLNGAKGEDETLFACRLPHSHRKIQFLVCRVMSMIVDGCRWFHCEARERQTNKQTDRPRSCKEEEAGEEDVSMSYGIWTLATEIERRCVVCSISTFIHILCLYQKPECTQEQTINLNSISSSSLPLSAMDTQSFLVKCVSIWATTLLLFVVCLVRRRVRVFMFKQQTHKFEPCETSRSEVNEKIR